MKNFIVAPLLFVTAFIAIPAHADHAFTPLARDILGCLGTSGIPSEKQLRRVLVFRNDSKLTVPHTSSSDIGKVFVMGYLKGQETPNTLYEKTDAISKVLDNDSGIISYHVHGAFVLDTESETLSPELSDELKVKAEPGIYFAASGSENVFQLTDQKITPGFLHSPQRAELEMICTNDVQTLRSWYAEVIPEMSF
jgi:hypothetical protein